jgi:hypothetical protein
MTNIIIRCVNIKTTENIGMWNRKGRLSKKGSVQFLILVTLILLYSRIKLSSMHLTNEALRYCRALHCTTKWKYFLVRHQQFLNCTEFSVTEKFVVRDPLLATEIDWHIGVIQHKVQTKLAGQGSTDGWATRYGLDGPRIESRWRARFSAPVQTGCGARPASYTMGTGLFLGVKRPGCGVDHPTSRAEGRERLELYIYSPTGPSWPVLG